MRMEWFLHDMYFKEVVSSEVHANKEDTFGVEKPTVKRKLVW